MTNRPKQLADQLNSHKTLWHSEKTRRAYGKVTYSSLTWFCRGYRSISVTLPHTGPTLRSWKVPLCSNSIIGLPESDQDHFWSSPPLHLTSPSKGVVGGFAHVACPTTPMHSAGSDSSTTEDDVPGRRIMYDSADAQR